MLLVSTANAAEAAVLIEYFELRFKAREPFPIFENTSMRLIISGSGKVHSSSAATYLLAISPEANAFLHFGLAGHASMEIGSLLLARKVTDASDGRSYYPSLIFDPPCETASVMTGERLSRDIDGNCCYDTEAFGFYAAADHFLPPEVVHCLKIIGLNQMSMPILTEKRRGELVEQQLQGIGAVVKGLQAAAAALAPAPERAPQTEPKMTLKEVFEKIEVFKSPEKKAPVDSAAERSEMLAFLKEKISKQPVS